MCDPVPGVEELEVVVVEIDDEPWVVPIDDCDVVAGEDAALWVQSGQGDCCWPAVAGASTPIALALPSGVYVEFSAAPEGIRVLLHGEPGVSELLFEGFVGSPVVAEPAVAVPEPTAQPLVMQDDTGLYEVGTPQVDTDGDARADAVVIEEQGLRTVAIDQDGDGWVDRVEVTDLATGDVGVFERQADGSWSPIHSPATDSPASAEVAVTDPFVVPAEIRLEPLAPDAPLTAQALRHLEESMVGFVSDFFPAAFPGQPWPTDETGRPYPAEVLLRMMTTDENEDRDIRSAALEVLADLEKARARVFQ